MCPWLTQRRHIAGGDSERMLRVMMTARASAAARRGHRPTAAATRSAAGAATATLTLTAAAIAVTLTRTMVFTSRCRQF